MTSVLTIWRLPKPAVVARHVRAVLSGVPLTVSGS